MTPDETLVYRMTRVEAEQERQRNRTHDLASQHNALRLLLQTNADDIKYLGGDVRALKRAFYTFAVSTVGAAIVFAFTVFALLGGKP